MTHEQIYEAFCNWSPEHAKMITDWKPWGSTSIVIWLNNTHAYKCKYHGPDKFIMQMVSKEDIKRKLGI